MEQLSVAVATLTARVAALEQRLGVSAAIPLPAAGDRPTDQPATSPPPPARSGIQLPAVGISLLMLAGAFLLRAVTEAGMLSPGVGIYLGLAYVVVLLLVTDREARRRLRAQAVLFGTATVLVAYPFIWETTTKLGLLPPAGAAVVTVLTTIAALGLALRHRFRLLAWIVLVATVVVCVGLYWTTDATVLFLAILVALGVVTVWLAYRLGWQGPQWLVGIVVNFLVFLTVMLAAHPAPELSGRPEPTSGGALPVALALPVVYLASFSWRTLIQRREAGGFEIVQSLGCLMAGYVGAIHLLHVEGRGTGALGWATLAAALAGYVVAFILVRGRQGRGLNFFYYAWLGLVLTFIGTALVVPGTVVPYLWGSLGVAAAVTGGIFDRWTLRLHCSAYLIGAAVVAGLGARFFEVFIAAGVPAWSDLTATGMVVWVLAVGSYVLLVAAQRGREVSGWRRVPRFLVAALGLIGAGILAVTAVSVGAVGTVSGPADVIVTVVRTVVLAVVTVILAALGRRPLLMEIAWFVNPLLVLLGLKVLVVDLRQGSPIALFFSFACFGIALIVAPRLRRRRHETDTETSPAPVVGDPGPASERRHETDSA